MGLLKSVKDVSGIDFYEYREINYYNRFKYRARLHINGLRYIYWQTRNIHQWERNLLNAISVKGDEYNEILKTKELVEKFLEYYNLFNKTKKTNKNTIIRLESNIAAIFSNDLSFLHEFKKWSNNLIIDFTECKISEFSGIKLFKKEPKNKYRIYLKSKRVDPLFHLEIHSLLKSHPKLHPSPALKHWVEFNIHVKNSWKRRWLSSNYFIDYNDESMLSYLTLMHGEILGKKYKLEKQSDII